MSPHFEFLLRERKAGKLYLSTTYVPPFKRGRIRHIWCQSDLYGPEYPPLTDGSPMLPGDISITYFDDSEDPNLGYSRDVRLF